ncbi:hypothetical protein JCM3775_003001 [Rhodotorula graminis]
MGRKPFRSRYGLSGPQPTFAAQGKAPSSGWGVRRAAAGKGSVSREGAFPETKGAKLVLSSDVELDSDGAPLPRKRRRVTAATSAAQLARSTAAETRVLNPAPLALDLLDSSDLDVKAVVSAHESDLEPDSDDPDRDSTRVARAKAVKRAVAAAPVAGPARDRADDLQSEMRRLRAEAAARRIERSKVVEVLDSDDEERAAEAEQERLAAGPNLVRTPAARAAGGTAAAGAVKGKGKGKKGKKGGQAKGRTLDEPSDEDDDAALKDLEAFRRKKQVGGGAAAPRASTSRAKGKSKVKERVALFNPASDDDDLDRDSDDSLPSLATLVQRSDARPAPRARQPQPSNSTSKHVDVRAQRRARALGRSASAFINDSDDEREGDRWGGGTVIATGGSGSGTFRLHGARRGGGRRLEEEAEEEQEQEQDASLPPPRRRRARSGSDSPPPQAPPPTQDYSHLGIASFVDPRAALARRKMREEMSSPPTSAFSSSDGEGEGDDDDGSSAAKSRRKKKKGGADEFVELDKHMKKRKRQFRDERRPGYSNPRRN